MRSKNPKDYEVVIQYNKYQVFDTGGMILDWYEDEPYKTFYLKSKDGTFKRRYSTESAPDWVMEIYRKCVTLD